MTLAYIIIGALLFGWGAICGTFATDRTVGPLMCTAIILLFAVVWACVMTLTGHL